MLLLFDMVLYSFLRSLKGKTALTNQGGRSGNYNTLQFIAKIIPRHFPISKNLIPLSRQTSERDPRENPTVRKLDETVTKGIPI